MLRDVLGFHAAEVADMLESTVESVNGPALKRARAGLRMKMPPGGDCLSAPACDSSVENAIVAKFVAAYESSDLASLVALLTDDVFVPMPPLPFEYEGREPVGRSFASIFGPGRKFDLVSTRSNGQPALGAYVRDSTGISHGVGLFVLTLAGDRICGMTRFESNVLSWFGLPRSLPLP
jgi:RNA polymerase sigma-70 factor (ECF subfamily)